MENNKYDNLYVDFNGVLVILHILQISRFVQV